MVGDFIFISIYLFYFFIFLFLFMKNFVRSLSLSIERFLKQHGIYDNLRGYYYSVIHLILMLFMTLIALFDNNIIHLCILLNIVGGITFFNVMFHGCPLTELEEKYYSNKTSITKLYKRRLKKAKIFHTCNHHYETVFELLINFCTVICLKICALILYKGYSLVT